MTELTQRIIETLCNEVWQLEQWHRLNPLGHVRDVDQWLSSKLHRPLKSVAGGTGWLVANGFLQEVDILDKDGFVLGQMIEITHKGWKAWSGFKTEPFHEPHMSLEEWEDWDGVDGTHLGFEFIGIKELPWCDSTTNTIYRQAK